MMTPHNEMQQILKDKCQRCFLADIKTCATANCCNLKLCTACFYHPDHACGPGPNSRPLRRCLKRCQQRLDSGWGERCWEPCKRAIDHKGFCDCLMDHSAAWSPRRVSLTAAVDQVPICPPMYSSVQPIAKAAAGIVSSTVMHYIGDGDQWHEWRPSASKGYGRGNALSSASSSSTMQPQQSLNQYIAAATGIPEPQASSSVSDGPISSSEDSMDSQGWMSCRPFRSRPFKHAYAHFLLSYMHYSFFSVCLSETTCIEQQ